MKKSENLMRFVSIFMVLALLVVSGLVVTNKGFKANEGEHHHTSDCLSEGPLCGETCDVNDCKYCWSPKSEEQTTTPEPSVDETEKDKKPTDDETEVDKTEKVTTVDNPENDENKKEVIDNIVVDEIKEIKEPEKLEESQVEEQTENTIVETVSSLFKGSRVMAAEPHHHTEDCYCKEIYGDNEVEKVKYEIAFVDQDLRVLDTIIEEAPEGDVDISKYCTDIDFKNKSTGDVYGKGTFKGILDFTDSAEIKLINDKNSFELKNKGSIQENGITLQYDVAFNQGDRVTATFIRGYYEGEGAGRRFIPIPGEEIIQLTQNKLGSFVGFRDSNDNYVDLVEEDKTIEGYKFIELEDRGLLMSSVDDDGKSYYVAFSGEAITGSHTFNIVYEKELIKTLIVAIRLDGDKYNGANYTMTHDKLPFYNNAHYIRPIEKSGVNLYDYFTKIEPIRDSKGASVHKAITSVLKGNTLMTEVDNWLTDKNIGNKNSFTVYVDGKPVPIGPDDRSKYEIEFTNLNWENGEPSSNEWHLDGVIKLKDTIKLDYNSNLESYGIERDGDSRIIPEPETKYVTGTSVEFTVKGDKDLTIKDKDGNAWRFKGWNTQSDGKGKSYTVDEKINVSTNTTLFAVWEKDANQQPENNTIEVKYVVRFPDGTQKTLDNITTGKIIGGVVNDASLNEDGNTVGGLATELVKLKVKEDDENETTLKISGIELENGKINGKESNAFNGEESILIAKVDGIDGDVKITIFYDVPGEKLNSSSNPTTSSNSTPTDTPDAPLVEPVEPEPVPSVPTDIPTIDGTPVPVDGAPIDEAPAEPVITLVPAPAPVPANGNTPIVQVTTDPEGNITLTEVEDVQAALANQELEHLCNILYFLILFSTTVALYLYYRSAKKHNERIFELRSALGEDDPYKKDNK